MQLPVPIVSFVLRRAVPAHRVGKLGFKQVVVGRGETLEHLGEPVALGTGEDDGLFAVQRAVEEERGLFHRVGTVGDHDVLVLAGEEDILALDAKITIDDSALYRRANILTQSVK